MVKYSESTIYVSAYAKLPTEMPSAELYKSLDMGLVIDKDTGEIFDSFYYTCNRRNKSIFEEHYSRLCD